MTNEKMHTPRPWYKEPWPWILASGPALVVVASFVSAWYALSTSDGLVEDDYYKKGLAAEKTVAASSKAIAQGVIASLGLTSERITLKVTSNDKNFEQPQAIFVTLSHPTQAGMDQMVRLPLAKGMYQGAFRLPRSGHWLVTIEDEKKSWRLLGNVVLPVTGDTVIGEYAPADIRNQR